MLCCAVRVSLLLARNAIGVVVCQALTYKVTHQRSRPLVPESTSIWGHTAVYVRVGNRIQIVRGFNPASMLDTIIKSSGIKAGTAGTPEKLHQTPGLFTKTSAQSVEFPVTLRQQIRL